MEVKFSIVLHPLVISQDIPVLDVFWRGEIRDVIRSKLTTAPELFGKPLRQSLAGHRVLRVSDYRIVYRIERPVVNVIAIFHRSTKYRGIERRT